MPRILGYSPRSLAMRHSRPSSARLKTGRGECAGKTDAMSVRADRSPAGAAAVAILLVSSGGRARSPIKPGDQDHGACPQPLGHGFAHPRPAAAGADATIHGGREPALDQWKGCRQRTSTWPPRRFASWHILASRWPVPDRRICRGSAGTDQSPRRDGSPRQRDSATTLAATRRSAHRMRANFTQLYIGEKRQQRAACK
jgi:hypothetical protein